MLDFHSGVTLSLLLAAVLRGTEDPSGRLSDAGREFGRRGDGPVPAGVFPATDMESFIRSLQAAVDGQTPLGAGQAAERAGGYGPMVRDLAALAQTDFLDPFTVSAYILLSFLRRQGNEAVTVLAPRVGSDSPDQVFSIFSDCRIRLAPGTPVIAPLCAAALAGLYSPFRAEMPAGVIRRTATVADPLDPDRTARIFFLDPDDSGADTVAVIQANIDDMTPEVLGRVGPLLLEHGALDFTIVHAVMKKGRPGFQVEVICRPADRAALEELLLRHTTTFGVRATLMERRVLERRIEKFDSAFGPIRVKKGYYRGELLRSVPEFEDLAALSEKTGIPLVRLYHDIQNEIARWPGKESV